MPATLRPSSVWRRRRSAARPPKTSCRTSSLPSGRTLPPMTQSADLFGPGYCRSPTIGSPTNCAGEAGARKSRPSPWRCGWGTSSKAGLRSLRLRLAPLVAALAGIAILGLFALRFLSGRTELARDERALTMLTSSDSEALRLTAPDAPESRIHGVYRHRPGSPIAVFTLSNFPPAPAGRVYRAWALRGRAWVPLGDARPGASGHARGIAEHPALASRPDRLEVTLEPEIGGMAPSGPIQIAWPPK